MGEKKTYSAFLENYTKKITAVLWFKILKCFKLKLLRFKICHLYWNHGTSEHSPTSTRTSETSFLPVFGICHLLPILPYNPCSYCPWHPLPRRGGVCHLTTGTCCLWLEPSKRKCDDQVTQVFLQEGGGKGTLAWAFVFHQATSRKLMHHPPSPFSSAIYVV